MNYTLDELRIALNELENELDKSIDKEYAHLPEHSFSRRFERNMKHIIQNPNQFENRPNGVGLSKKIAAILVFVLLGVAVTTLSVDAYRERFINIITSWTNKSVDYEFKIATDKYYYADLTKTVFGYVPEDYEKVEETYNSDFYSRVLYKNGDDYFRVSLSVISKQSSSTVSIDSEHSEIFNIKVRGEDAVLRVSSESCSLIWGQKNVLCHLYGTMDKEEAVKIAESIEIYFLDGME